MPSNKNIHFSRNPSQSRTTAAAPSSLQNVVSRRTKKTSQRRPNCNRRRTFVSGVTLSVRKSFVNIVARQKNTTVATEAPSTCSSDSTLSEQPRELPPVSELRLSKQGLVSVLADEPELSGWDFHPPFVPPAEITIVVPTQPHKSETPMVPLKRDVSSSMYSFVSKDYSELSDRLSIFLHEESELTFKLVEMERAEI